MNEVDKSKCPKCGSELYMSRWFVDDRLYRLTPDGKRKKRTFKILKRHPYDMESGIVCSNMDCHYTTVPSGRVY